MSRASASALAAASCRPTCAVRPRWPRCCPSCTCAGSLPAISARRWTALRRERERRGLAAPVVAVGDGALGFWAATREVWPETREQACWCHKLANVLDKLPQRLQPRAKRALHEMMYAACRTDCAAARSRFEAEYQAKYPRAVESLTANWERLVTFFDFPAEHWKHLRTTKVIEPPFAPVRLP